MLINNPSMFWASPRHIIYFSHYQTSHGPGTTADAIHKPTGPPGKYIYCQVSNIYFLFGQFTSEQGVEMNKFLFSPHKQGAQMTKVTQVT